MSRFGQPVLLALHRIGPYHDVRLRAAAASLPLAALETRPQSQEYPWAFMPTAPIPIHRLEGAADPETDPPLASLDRQLDSLLDRLRPGAIVSVGWADRAYQRLLIAAHRRRIPLVIVSDSRERDEPRSPLKEAIKRLLLQGYSAALVAGRESRAYLEGLGFPPAAIFQPWDVVDNAFFAAAAPSPAHPSHFLCVSRFVAKKNHAGLLQAYGTYQRQGGRWGLRLIGSGPLEADIRKLVAALPDPARVRVDPFLQLEDLRRAYGQARAFVLASGSDQWGLVVNEAMAAGLPCLVSSACGCAADLIEPGVTGWSFEPADPAALTALLHQMGRQNEAGRREMVAAARRRLEAFTPESFAEALLQVVRAAQRNPRRSRRAVLTAGLLSTMRA